MNIIKKLVTNWSAILCLTLCATVVCSSCGDDDDNLPVNEGVAPDKEVPDPIGNITLSMRDDNNGRTYLDYIYIKNENFKGEAWWDGRTSQSTYFASLGAVKGLGNVAHIPTTGWATQVAVVLGSGYVAYSQDKYYRIYVKDYVISTSGGIIGAEVKYQEPFKGKDEAISLDVQSLTFPAEGGSQTLTFRNQGVIPFDVEAERCKVEKTSTYDYSFLTNGIIVTADPNTSLEGREGTVTLTTLYGKKTVLKVTQAGEEPTIKVDKDIIGFSKNAGSRTVTINTLVKDWEAESSADWCTLTKTNNLINIHVTASTKNRTAIISFKGFDTKITIHQSKYAKGDTYSEDGIEGTVGYIGDKARYIYKELGEAAWSTEQVLTGANSEDDGEYNMNVIKKIPYWTDRYPAFLLCEQLNTGGVTGWYLPAKNEAILLYPDKEKYGYWNSLSYLSSTERNSSNAYYYNYHDFTHYEESTSKSSAISVIAVHKF